MKGITLKNKKALNVNEAVKYFFCFLIPTIVVSFCFKCDIRDPAGSFHQKQEIENPLSLYLHNAPALSKFGLRTLVDA